MAQDDEMDLAEFLRQLKRARGPFSDSGTINSTQIDALRRERNLAIHKIVSAVAVSKSRQTSEWQPNVHTATHEATNLVLGEQRHPRTGTVLPFCMQGQSCVVSYIDNTPTVALSIQLSPTERELWESTGKVPPDSESRMCVLCSRFNLEAFWRIAESTNAAAGPCCPTFVNLCDVPDGYDSRWMIGPSSGPHVLSASVVRHVPHMLTIERGPNGRLFVDESKIRFGAPKHHLN